MLKTDTKITWRTNGRGVTRVLKGTITGLVKAGNLPNKSLQATLPHGSDPSNRDRYIVALDKTGILVWCNCGSCVEAGNKLPKHNPRLSKPVKKAKTFIAKQVKKALKAKAKTAAKVIAKEKPVAPAPVAKKSGGDKPKTTWYGIVDGKVTSVRKVVCPEGFSKEKPVITAPAAPPQDPPKSVEPETTTPPALPQASVG